MFIEKKVSFQSSVIATLAVFELNSVATNDNLVDHVTKKNPIANFTPKRAKQSHVTIPLVHSGSAFRGVFLTVMLVVVKLLSHEMVRVLFLGKYEITLLRE